MTQRPELFRAVVCSYPLLDMVRYHQFLVARYWVPEYGSADDAAQFPSLRAYSPYHNVKKGVALSGRAVHHRRRRHARGPAARAQDGGPRCRPRRAHRADRPVLLHYDTKAGHSGGLPASKQIEDLTQEMRFLFWQLGVS